MTARALLQENGISVQRMRLPSTYFGDHGAKSGRMYGKDGQLESLGRCFRDGLGIRAAAKRVGCAKDTARKLYAILQQNGADFRCGCGKELAHKGTCPTRWPLASAPTERIARRRAIVRRATAKWDAKRKTRNAELAQLAEHLTASQDVAGSSPALRSGCKTSPIGRIEDVGESGSAIEPADSENDSRAPRRSK